MIRNMRVLIVGFVADLIARSRFHPYFAVSGADGTFEIASLPPGTYTLEAWHEKLGTMTQQVVVTAKQAKDVTFVFKVS